MAAPVPAYFVCNFKLVNFSTYNYESPSCLEEEEEEAEDLVIRWDHVGDISDHKGFAWLKIQNM